MMLYCFLVRSRENETYVTAKAIIKLSQSFVNSIHQNKKKGNHSTINKTSIYCFSVDRHFRGHSLLCEFI